MTWYTVFYKHTCPHTTWAEDLNRSYPPEILAQKIYGDQAGKTLDDRMFMRRIETSDLSEVERVAKADAIPGWGTLIICVLEGYARLALEADHVIALEDRPHTERRGG